MNTKFADKFKNLLKDDDEDFDSPDGVNLDDGTIYIEDDGEQRIVSAEEVVRIGDGHELNALSQGDSECVYVFDPALFFESLGHDPESESAHKMLVFCENYFDRHIPKTGGFQHDDEEDVFFFRFSMREKEGWQEVYKLVNAVGDQLLRDSFRPVALETEETSEASEEATSHAPAPLGVTDEIASGQAEAAPQARGDIDGASEDDATKEPSWGDLQASHEKKDAPKEWQHFKADKPPAADTSGPNVLLVDDDPHSLNLIATYLSELNYRNIVQASNGRDAIKHIAEKKGQFDLIISDWQMPEMDGLELLKRIRQNSLNIPFIMVTGRPTKELVVSARQARVSSFLGKPIDRDQFREKVQNFI